MALNKAVIALNGIINGDSDDYLKHIDKNSFFLAADGGTLFFEKLGIIPDAIIGDMDSLTETQLNKYKKNNIDIKQFAIEKDKTDGELALDYCKHNNYQQINIIGAIGGRIDQQLANIYLLEYALKLEMEAVIREANIEIGILNQKKNVKTFFEKQNYRLSLISLSNKVTGVTIKGCKYKLKQSSLYRYQTRGISNQIKERQAKVFIKTGVLLYIIES